MFPPHFLSLFHSMSLISQGKRLVPSQQRNGGDFTVSSFHHGWLCKDYANPDCTNISPHLDVALAIIFLIFWTPHHPQVFLYKTHVLVFPRSTSKYEKNYFFWNDYAKTEYFKILIFIPIFGLIQPMLVQINLHAS